MGKETKEQVCLLINMRLAQNCIITQEGCGGRVTEREWRQIEDVS